MENKMENLKDITESLKNYAKNIQIRECAKNKYFINTGLFLIASGDILPIYLVEYNGRTYFADYGGTLKSLNVDFDKLDTKTQLLIKQKLSDLEVEFDGLTLKFEVIKNYEFGSLNTLICAIMFLQTLL